MASKPKEKQENNSQPKTTISKSPSPDDSLNNYADIEDSDTDIENTAENTNMMQESEDTSNESKPLSLQRRLCLLGALLLCIFTIFAFAFLIPCHQASCAEGKCKTKSFWSVNFTNVVPVMLKQVDGKKGGKADVIVGFSTRPINNSNSPFVKRICQNTKCHSGLMTLSSCDGRKLWNSGFNGSLALLVCQNQEKHKNTLPGCLVLERQSKLHLMDSHNGEKKWAANEMGKVHGFRTIHDMDNDGVKDIVIVRDSPVTARAKGSSRDYIIATKGTITILSGKSGRPIGRSLIIPGHKNGTIVLLVHEVFSYQQFVLVGSKLPNQETGTLLAIEVKDLANWARDSWKKKSGTSWGINRPDTQSGFIKLFQDTLVLTEPMIADLNSDGVYDIVLLTKDDEFTVRALNGKNAELLWKRVLPTDTIDRAISASITLSKKLSHIGIMLKFTNQTSAVLVLNGHTGSIMWTFYLSSPLTIPPVGIPKMKNIPGGLLLWLPKSEIIRYLNTSIVKSLDDENEERFDSKLNNGNLWENFWMTKERIRRESINSDKKSRKRVLINVIKRLLAERVEERYGYKKELVRSLAESKTREFATRVITDLMKWGKLDEHLDHSDDNDDDNNDDVDNEQLSIEQKIAVIEKLKAILLQEMLTHNTVSNVNDTVEDFSGRKDQRSVKMTPLQKFLDNWRERLQRRDAAERLSSTAGPMQTTTQPATNASTMPNVNQTVNTDASGISKTNTPVDTPSPTTVEFTPDDPLVGSTHSPTTVEFTPDDPPTSGTEYDGWSSNDINQSSICQPCSMDPLDTSSVLSGVLMYKDDGLLKVKIVAEEIPILLGPEQYRKQFGEDFPSQTCMKLLPRITSTPVITNLDKTTGQLEMVYTIDHTTQPCPGSSNLDVQPRHVMTVKKIDILQAMKRFDKVGENRGKGTAFESGDESGHKRNEIFESPFSKWGFR